MPLVASTTDNPQIADNVVDSNLQTKAGVIIVSIVGSPPVSF
jgi:hypothetical protein